MSNKNLHEAKKAKNDEFYTRYEDIVKELDYYISYNPDVFRDKVILCPCDPPGFFNFEKYFVDNFDRLGIGKLIVSGMAYGDKPARVKIYTKEGFNTSQN